MTDWRRDPRRVLAVYNSALERMGRDPRPYTPRVLSEAGDFGLWCIEHGVIDIEAYVAARHEAIAPGIRVPLLRLRSLTFLRKYREWWHDHQAAERRQEALKAAVVDDTPLHSAELRALWEQSKAQFAEDPRVCILMLEMTGGWNPRSRWCQSCVYAAECKGELDPAVVEARKL